MDFRTRMLHTLPDNVPLPFYMTYPGYLGGDREQDILKDMEYLQQTYPAKVRMYQRRVAEILDKLDYEGSMIYDEYPDKYQLQRLARTVTEMLKQEDGLQEAMTQEQQEGRDEKWRYMENLLLVLVCDDVCKRRHGRGTDRMRLLGI
ncbi:MAG: hypothetical protein NC081_01155 [Roseburia sp.]|nr:hypothetical protein [Roseburia sp.]